MQEQKNVAAGLVRAGVHLQSASARGIDHQRTRCPGQRLGCVGAATIGHDDLGATYRQLCQRLQGRINAGRFIQHRHDH